MPPEFEIAAVGDSLSHLIGGRSKHVPQPGATCANCAAPLQGAYCHVCGQNSDTHKRSILRLIWEAVETTFELDGRLVRTVPALFFRPGALARDYIDGRIVRHVPPFRTFLVALVIFIFAAQHATHEQTVAQAHTKALETAALATPQGRAAAVARRRTEAARELADDLKDAANDRAESLKDPDEKPDKIAAAYDRHVKRAQARNVKLLARADRVAQGLPADLPEDNSAVKKAEGWWQPGVRKAVANPDYYWTIVFTWAQRLAVILLPVVGLSLALVYRKRQEVFLYDHLLVAMNLLSFSFLTSAVGLVLPASIMPWWFGFVALWAPINLFQTLRGAYGSTILGAVLKTLIVWLIGLFASFALLTSLLVLAVGEL